MAADLPGLPVELIHQILECDTWYRSRRYICEALRLTCKELNAKILRYYGSEYYKTMNVPLTETGLTRILNISAGQLAYHVESLVIDCDTILSKHNFNCSSQSSDFNKNDWWDGDSNDSFGEYCFTRISFDDRIMDLLKFGGCADLLGRFLSGFSNL
jgi:hypothetical protein